MFKIIVFVCLSALATTTAFAKLRMGPIEVCEKEQQLIADIGSCTRYHRCRKVQDLDEFTTDIAICNQDQVFDMITSECVDATTPFLQDPESCNTFYGCHPTKETSEGFVRRHYRCPGNLRFHPIAKYCTFQTDVTDNLCNSQSPDTRIIGKFQLDDATAIGALGLPSRRIGRPRPNIPRLNNNNQLLNSPSILTQFSGLPQRSSDSGKENPILNLNPSAESSLDKIAQVISGQLLTLQNKEKRPKKNDVLAKESSKKKE